jgi:hypothetical protein
MPTGGRGTEGSGPSIHPPCGTTLRVLLPLVPAPAGEAVL